MNERHPLSAAVLVAALLVAGVAACSSDDSTTESPTATASSQITQGQSGSPTSDAQASPDAAAPTVTLGGVGVEGDFRPVRCKWGTDEGQRQLEYDAGSDSSGSDVSVEIVMLDPPKLDDFTLETEGVEWEATNENRQQATISVEGDTYRVTSAVEADDDATRTNELVVTFVCPAA